jgi:hypothetical protein
MRWVRGRDENLFPRHPGDVPNWMVIRDTNDKRTKENEARLRAVRLARDAREAAQEKTSAPLRRKRSHKK